MGTTYTTNSKRKRPDEQATFRIVAVKCKKELLVFATNTDIKPKAIRRMFRKRWAIDTSYRMINQLQFFYTTYGFLLTIKGKR